MAEIIKGKRKGQTCKVLQWCNDWFQVDVAGLPLIVGPTMLKLTPEEMDALLIGSACGYAGTMFKEFTMRPDGTFARNKRRSLTA